MYYPAGVKMGLGLMGKPFRAWVGAWVATWGHGWVHGSLDLGVGDGNGRTLHLVIGMMLVSNKKMGLCLYRRIRLFHN